MTELEALALLFIGGCLGAVIMAIMNVGSSRDDRAQREALDKEHRHDRA